MRHSVIRLSRRHEWFAYLVSAAVFLTGAAWAWLRYLGKPPNDLGASNPAETWLMKVHGGAAMLALILLGTLLPLHIKFALRAGRNLRTGLTLFAVFGFLCVTGYGLYYAGDEHFRAWTSTAHLWVGLALPAIISLHVWRGKTTRPGTKRR